MAQALAEDVLAAGGSVVDRVRGRPGRTQDGRVTLEHAAGRTVARRAVFCAGAWADGFAGRAGAPAEPRIIPFRGAYRTVRPEAAHLVRGQIYPVPDPELPFLGVHLTPGHRRQRARGPDGPDGRRPRRVPPPPGRPARPARHARLARDLAHGAPVVAHRARELRNAVSDRAVAAAVARLVPAIGHADLGPGPAGVRAQAVGRDGALSTTSSCPATGRRCTSATRPSPAATSALALARLIADRAEEQFGLEPTRG